MFEGQKGNSATPRGVITLTEVLRIIDSGQPISSMTVVTADRRKGTGGQLRTYQHVHLCRLDSVSANTLKRNGLHSTAMRKWANHYDNKTRNIIDPRSQEIRKVHIKLITSFEGKQVLL